MYLNTPTENPQSTGIREVKYSRVAWVPFCKTANLGTLNKLPINDKLLSFNNPNLGGTCAIELLLKSKIFNSGICSNPETSMP